MKIKVYGKQIGCMQCMFTKRYLDESDVVYEYLDIMQDEELLQSFKEQGYTSLPIVTVDDVVYTTGFAIEDLEKLVEESV